MRGVTQSFPKQILSTSTLEIFLVRKEAQIALKISYCQQYQGLLHVRGMQIYLSRRGLGREIDKSYGSMRAERKNFHIYDMTMEMSKIKMINKKY